MKVEPHEWDQCPSNRDPRELLHHPKGWEHREWLSGNLDIEPAGSLTLDFPASRAVTNCCCS